MIILKQKEPYFPKLVSDAYRILSNKPPQSLFNFGVLRCSAYWRTVLTGGRHLFQRQRNYSQEISEMCNFLFPNKNK